MALEAGSPSWASTKYNHKADMPAAMQRTPGRLNHEVSRFSLLGPAANAGEKDSPFFMSKLTFAPGNSFPAILQRGDNLLASYGGFAYSILA
jgi:hypothetical protein